MPAENCTRTLRAKEQHHSESATYRGHPLERVSQRTQERDKHLLSPPGGSPTFSFISFNPNLDPDPGRGCHNFEKQKAVNNQPTRSVDTRSHHLFPRGPCPLMLAGGGITEGLLCTEQRAWASASAPRSDQGGKWVQSPCLKEGAGVSDRSLGNTQKLDITFRG